MGALSLRKNYFLSGLVVGNIAESSCTSRMWWGLVAGYFVKDSCLEVGSKL